MHTFRDYMEVLKSSTRNLKKSYKSQMKKLKILDTKNYEEIHKLVKDAFRKKAPTNEFLKETEFFYLERLLYFYKEYCDSKNQQIDLLKTKSQRETQENSILLKEILMRLL